MKIMVGFCLVLLLSSCATRGHSSYIQPLRVLKTSYAKEVGGKYQLVLVGEGGKGIGQLEKVYLYFKSSKGMTVEKVREMYVPVVNGLLAKINANQQMRPYLYEYPFSAKDVNVAITFFDKNDQPFQGDRVAMVSMLNGKIAYYTFNPKTKSYQMFLEEEFQQAIFLVSEKQGL